VSQAHPAEDNHGNSQDADASPTIHPAPSYLSNKTEV
jgi:hypothetical protein